MCVCWCVCLFGVYTPKKKVYTHEYTSYHTGKEKKGHEREVEEVTYMKWSQTLKPSASYSFRKTEWNGCTLPLENTLPVVKGSSLRYT